MKVCKRALRSQEIIDRMVTLLDYYMGGTKEFKKLVREDVQYLEEYLNEISEEHKIHNIRFATKLKALWKKDMEKKDEVIKKLESKIEDLT